MTELLEQPDLFPEYEAEKIMNPMIRQFGTGPQGTYCKDCKHIISKHHGNTYFKCELRGNTNGPGTDHRRSWQSCKKYLPND